MHGAAGRGDLDDVRRGRGPHRRRRRGWGRPRRTADRGAAGGGDPLRGRPRPGAPASAAYLLLLGARRRPGRRRARRPGRLAARGWPLLRHRVGDLLERPAGVLGAAGRAATDRRRHRLHRRRPRRRRPSGGGVQQHHGRPLAERSRVPGLRLPGRAGRALRPGAAPGAAHRRQQHLRRRRPRPGRPSRPGVHRARGSTRVPRRPRRPACRPLHRPARRRPEHALRAGGRLQPQRLARPAGGGLHLRRQARHHGRLVGDLSRFTRGFVQCAPHLAAYLHQGQCPRRRPGRRRLAGRDLLRRARLPGHLSRRPRRLFRATHEPHSPGYRRAGQRGRHQLRRPHRQRHAWT